MTKPTEGPFHLLEGQEEISVMDSKDHCLACFWVGDLAYEEALANARLFVASHNLLGELKWFMDDLRATHSTMAHFDEHVAAARAAIKKAAGE